MWADRVGHALAELLDAPGDEVVSIDAAVRWQARESCRVLLGLRWSDLDLEGQALTIVNMRTLVEGEMLEKGPK